MILYNDPCINSDITIWVNKISAKFKSDISGDTFTVNETIRDGRVEIANRLQTKVEVLLDIVVLDLCSKLILTVLYFRYRFAYRKGNATIIKAPDPISAKNYKRLTKNFCVERNQNFHDIQALSEPRRTLSRSKKDIFQILEVKDNARNLSESKHEYEIIENEINTGGIYENIHPEEETSEEHDDYENENEDERIEEEEGNFIEDFGYEDENEDDEKNFSDYENEEISEEKDSENDEEGDEVNYDENSDEDDDESNENDENEPHQYDSINMIETDDLSEDENYDNEHDNLEEIDKNCDSDESDENSEESEESEDETEDPNENEEILEIKDAKILEKNSINSANAVHDNRNHMRRRIRINNKLDTMVYNKGINRRNNFPRRRMHNFRNRRRQNLPFTRNQPFKPWKESNRAKWQRKHKINEIKNQ
ncbi:hypothetical protein Avbf_14782 [Armadillidium vulgare]|nr:hypothetical protein Avbf_14782 [Armadillidium vulgare]